MVALGVTPSTALPTSCGSRHAQAPFAPSSPTLPVLSGTSEEAILLAARTFRSASRCALAAPRQQPAAQAVQQPAAQAVQQPAAQAVQQPSRQRDYGQRRREAVIAALAELPLLLQYVQADRQLRRLVREHALAAAAADMQQQFQSLFEQPQLSKVWQKLQEIIAAAVSRLYCMHVCIANLRRADALLETYKLLDGSPVEASLLGRSGYVEWGRTFEGSDRFVVLEVDPNSTSSSSSSSSVSYTVRSAEIEDLRAGFEGLQVEVGSACVARQLERWLQRRAQLAGAEQFPSQVLFYAERGGSGSTSAEIPYTVAVVYSKYKWEQLDVVAACVGSQAYSLSLGRNRYLVAIKVKHGIRVTFLEVQMNEAFKAAWQASQRASSSIWRSSSTPPTTSSEADASEGDAFVDAALHLSLTGDVTPTVEQVLDEVASAEQALAAAAAAAAAAAQTPPAAAAAPAPSGSAATTAAGWLSPAAALAAAAAADDDDSGSDDELLAQLLADADADEGVPSSTTTAAPAPAAAAAVAGGRAQGGLQFPPPPPPAAAAPAAAAAAGNERWRSRQGRQGKGSLSRNRAAYQQRRLGKCWLCGHPGHKRADCPKRRHGG